MRVDLVTRLTVPAGAASSSAGSTRRLAPGEGVGHGPAA